MDSHRRKGREEEKGVVATPVQREETMEGAKRVGAEVVVVVVVVLRVLTEPNDGTCRKRWTEREVV